MFQIDGWFERGVPVTSDRINANNINEIMLLPSAIGKVTYIGSKTINAILNSLT